MQLRSGSRSRSRSRSRPRPRPSTVRRRRSKSIPRRAVEPAAMDLEKDMQSSVPPSLKGEWWNIAILIVLYFLQGVPMGLARAVPLYLQKHVDESAIATFMLCAWPYSVKILWAPVVDSVYSPTVGRRKSWVVPVQLLVGAALLGLATSFDALLLSDPPQIMVLTLGFLFLYFLVATQDIAVDGWALTMLRRENVGYASTCNSVGQTAGFLVSYVGILSLTSADFCNRVRDYFGWELSEEGAVTMPGYLQFWGATFILVTVLVAMFKSEPPETPVATSQASVVPSHATLPPDSGWAAIKAAYIEMRAVIRLKNVAILAVVLLTSRLAFLTETDLELKLLKQNVSNEDLMLYLMPIPVLEMAVTVCLSRTLSGPRPMTAYLWGFVGRLIGLVAYAAMFVFVPPADADGQGPIMVAFLLITAAFRVPCQVMFGAQMAFFAKVADPALGGTYMTLLNTLANLGYMWTSQVGLRSISFVNAALGTTGKDAVDGFLIVTVVSTVVGVGWLAVFGRRILALQSAKMGDWRGDTGPVWLRWGAVN